MSYSTPSSDTQDFIKVDVWVNNFPRAYIEGKLEKEKTTSFRYFFYSCEKSG